MFTKVNERLAAALGVDLSDGDVRSIHIALGADHWPLVTVERVMSPGAAAELGVELKRYRLVEIDRDDAERIG